MQVDVRRLSYHPSRFMWRGCKITVDKGVTAVSIYRNKTMENDNTFYQSPNVPKVAKGRDEKNFF